MVLLFYNASTRFIPLPEPSEYCIPGEYNVILDDDTNTSDYIKHLEKVEADLNEDNMMRDQSRRAMGLGPVAEEERYKILDVRPDSYLVRMSDDRAYNYLRRHRKV